MLIVCLNSPNTNQPPQKKKTEWTQPNPTKATFESDPQWGKGQIEGGATSNFGGIKGHSRHSIPPLEPFKKITVNPCYQTVLLVPKNSMVPIFLNWSLFFLEKFLFELAGEKQGILDCWWPFQSKVVGGDLQLTRGWSLVILNDILQGFLAPKNQLINRAIWCPF